MPGHRLAFYGSICGLPVFIEKSFDANECIHRDVVEAFAALLKQLASVYNVAESAVHIYAHPGGRTVAFNAGGALFFNVSYYEVYHSHGMVSGREAAAYW